jgi:hypothetical protein
MGTEGRKNSFYKRIFCRNLFKRPLRLGKIKGVQESLFSLLSVESRPLLWGRFCGERADPVSVVGRNRSKYVLERFENRRLVFSQDHPHKFGWVNAQRFRQGGNSIYRNFGRSMFHHGQNVRLWKLTFFTAKVESGPGIGSDALVPTHGIACLITAE